eukprot:COSAG06_NODE_3136_length_5804_cov_2.662752_7_plen_80_part_00
MSVFFLNSRADDSLPPDAGQGDAIMTPDTFKFPTGEQAFIYLGTFNFNSILFRYFVSFWWYVHLVCVCRSVYSLSVIQV